MLGLEEEGAESVLDKAGKEMLEELQSTIRAATKQLSTEPRSVPVEDSSRQLGMASRGSSKQRITEPQVRLSQRGRWFSISTSVLKTETAVIGDQMNLAFQRIQGKFSLPPMIACVNPNAFSPFASLLYTR